MKQLNMGTGAGGGKQRPTKEMPQPVKTPPKKK